MNRHVFKLFSFVTILGLVFSSVPMQGALAATPTELFISEYIEGSSFNKAVEIYNGTGVTVDLSTYTLELYSNGASSPSQSVSLSGTLANGDVFVIAHASADAAILAASDAISSAVINFNGDDALVLKNNGTVVDSFGQVGVDPGSQWPGGGQDDTLRRVDSVCAGDTNPGDAFDASIEWVTFAQNTFDGLGAHTANCDGGSGGPGVASVLINEVDSDTPGSDTAEFVELYDGGAGATDLTGLVVVFYNGSNDLSYAAFDLDGYSTNSDGYFVMGNSGVSGVSLFFAGNGLQNGADAVAVYVGDAADFPSGTAVVTDNLVDAVVYDTSDSDDAGLLVLLNAGQPQVDENSGGDSANQSSQRCPDGSGGARNTDTFAQFAPTPGAENTCVIPILEAKIHDIQGNGAASPLVGQIVAIEGIVVGDFQDGASGTNGDLNGFHVQEEDADADADPLTSEGIFVYNGSSPSVDVNIGDLVRVEGAVSEYNGLTEMSSFTGVTVISSGNALPTASILSLPVANVDDFEAYEGMYVTFPQALVISEYFNFDRFGEIVLTSERHLTPTAEVEPGPDAIAAANAFLLDKITLDDGRSNQNPDPAIHPNGFDFDLTNLFRGGDTVANVTGVMDYSFSLYRIQPTQGADYTSVNLRTSSPDPVGGDLRVSSFNVLNYFSTLDNSGFICGPAQDQECRGADNANEFTRQRDKTIAALSAIDADVVGLLEIENNVNDDAVIDLVNGLNAVNGAGTYAYVSTGTIGTDAIKVALIYKPASVTPAGDYAILDTSVDPRFLDTKNRPALAQTFEVNATGARFTVVVNHLKSKGSACDDVGDPDTGDGAGNCNGTRTAAAEAIVDWLASDPTASGDEDFLIIGDLNSYDKEAPIDALVAGGFTDLIYAYHGEDAYSYVFDGQTGYLDYALAVAGLVDQVTGVTEWHINADEPDLIDYDTSFKLPAQDAIYAPDAYRASDHDPIIIGLDLNAPPVCSEAAPSVTSLWPNNHKFVPIDILGIFDPNGDSWTLTITSIFQDELVNGTNDGNTSPDGQGVGTSIAQVRAERSDDGDGRFYHIAFTVDDGRSGTCSGEVTVNVPKSQDPKLKSYDGGALFDSTLIP